MKKWIILFPLIILACSRGKVDSPAEKDNTKVRSARPAKVEGLDVYSYAIYTETDTIEYIKIGADTLTAKPTLLFLQGSLPKPLIFDLGTFKHINLPFDHKALTDSYHLIEIAMPKTPVSAGTEHLNQQYCYVPDTAAPDSYRKSYLKANYLANYVSRTNQVINDLVKKQWVNKDSIMAIGHSQGAKVAAVVASENNQLAAVALLGFNAYGRFDEFIRRERQKLKAGQITGEEYHNNIKAHYQQWAEIQADPDNFEKGHKAWTSFSINYMPYLLKIDIPIFIGYGTVDIIAENCDLLPIEFIQNGKENLTLRPYLGLDHNFFELKKGRPDRRNGAHFSDVINDITDWTKDS